MHDVKTVEYAVAVGFVTEEQAVMWCERLFKSSNPEYIVMESRLVDTRYEMRWVAVTGARSEFFNVPVEEAQDGEN
jgi:hypothetical protein